MSCIRCGKPTPKDCNFCTEHAPDIGGGKEIHFNEIIIENLPEDFTAFKVRTFLSQYCNADPLIINIHGVTEDQSKFHKVALVKGVQSSSLVKDINGLELGGEKITAKFGGVDIKKL